MSIIGSLPYNMVNGQTADATQVMADFNTIVNAVNNATTGAASIPQVQTNSLRYAADTGSVNAIIIGVSPSPALTDGMEFTTKVANTNTSTTVTVQVGSGTAKGAVIDPSGTLPPVGSLPVGWYAKFTYSSSLDKYILMNPSRATASATITLTGFTATITGTINYVIGNDGKTFYISILADILGTSNATTMTATGWPSALIPASAKNINNITGRDNGANITVITLQLPNSGTTVTFSNGSRVTGSMPVAFTGSAGKGIYTNVISGTLD